MMNDTAEWSCPAETEERWQGSELSSHVTSRTTVLYRAVLVPRLAGMRTTNSNWTARPMWLLLFSLMEVDNASTAFPFCVSTSSTGP